MPIALPPISVWSPPPANPARIAITAASPNKEPVTPVGCWCKPPNKSAVIPGPLGAFFRRLAQRKNRNVAVVATARKLVTIAWHMLKNNEPYRYAQPKTVEAKLSRLRVRATGRKKKAGTKGQKRSPNYGTGKRMRTIPSLDQIYATEQLPPIAPLRPREKAMLATHGVPPTPLASAKPNVWRDVLRLSRTFAVRRVERS